MDRVTRGLLKSYVETAGISGQSESQQFERFATHVILSKLYGGTFSADDFCVGDGVQGIDAAALAINGVLIADPDELEDALEHPGPISAEFVLLQAKTSAKFELGDLSIFADTASALITSADECPKALAEFTAISISCGNTPTDSPRIRLHASTTCRAGNGRNLNRFFRRWGPPSGLFSTPI